MNQLSIDKQIVLSDKIEFAIHETIYSTFTENKYNEKIVELNQTSEDTSKYDFRFNCFLNQLTDNVITEDIIQYKMFIYDDEQLD